MQSDDPIQTIKSKLTELETKIIPGLFSIGVLLLFVGNIPLGIGLISAGFAYMGYKEVQGEEYDTAGFQTKMDTIMESVFLGLAAIGVMLVFLDIYRLVLD